MAAKSCIYEPALNKFMSVPPFLFVKDVFRDTSHVKNVTVKHLQDLFFKFKISATLLFFILLVLDSGSSILVY